MLQCSSDAQSDRVVHAGSKKVSTLSSEICSFSLALFCAAVGYLSVSCKLCVKTVELLVIKAEEF